MSWSAKVFGIQKLAQAEGRTNNNCRMAKVTFVSRNMFITINLFFNFMKRFWSRDTRACAVSKYNYNFFSENRDPTLYIILGYLPMYIQSVVRIKKYVEISAWSKRNSTIQIYCFKNVITHYLEYTIFFKSWIIQKEILIF